MYTLSFKQVSIFVIFAAGSFLVSCSDSGRNAMGPFLNSVDAGETPLAANLSDGTFEEQAAAPMTKGIDDPTNVYSIDASEPSDAQSSSFLFLNLRSYVYLDELEQSTNLMRFHSDYVANSPVIDHERLICFSQQFSLYRPSLVIDKGLVPSEYGPPDYRSRVVTSFPGYPEGEPLTCQWAVDGEVRESRQIELNQDGYDFPKIKGVIPVINEKTNELEIYVVAKRDRGNLRNLSIMAEMPGSYGDANLVLEGNSFEGWVNTGATVPEGTENVTIRLYVFGEAGLVTSGYASYLEIQRGQPNIYVKQNIDPVFAELTPMEIAELMQTTMEREPALEQ